MKNTIILLFVFLVVSQSKSQNITLGPDGDLLNIGNKVSFLEDKSGTLTFEDVNSPKLRDSFQLSKKTILNFGFTESLYWLRFQFDNPEGKDLMLEISHAFLPIAELYYRDDTGTIQKLSAGYHVPVNDKLVPSHFQVFPLAKGKHEYYVRILSNSHPLHVRIMSHVAFDIKNYKQRLGYGIYLGFMAFVFISNLFFFFSLKNKMYLFYAFIVVLYFSYAACVMDGFIVFFVPKVDMMFWYTTIPTIGVTVQTIYCLLFLEVRKFAPKLNRFTWGVVAYFALYMLLKFLLPLTAVLAINTLNALISFFLMGFIGFKVGKRGNRLGNYFAIAYIIYFLLVLTEATYVQTGNPPYLADISHVTYATLIEAFVLSFLLSKRFEWEKREVEEAKQEAQRQLIESTLEKESLVREQNAVLEKEVANRTQELQNTNEQLNTTLHTVEMEREKSDNLLLNILPAATAAELKEKGVAKPQMHKLVTVLFTDFVDFTNLSEKMTHEELVHNLNFCYSEFDKIVREHHLEKIKTIGDAYMAAGGLPRANDTHPSDAVYAALEMLSFIQKWKKDQEDQGKIGWDLRIGINTGQVVSGVVGRHKFSYDIWGDTVNTASRMENLSEPGKLNISQPTYELVKNKFQCTSRGQIAVKGKGLAEMYFVDGRKQA